MGIGITQKTIYESWSNKVLLGEHRSIKQKRPSSVWYGRGDRKVIKAEIERRKSAGLMKRSADKPRPRSTGFNPFGY